MELSIHYYINLQNCRVWNTKLYIIRISSNSRTDESLFIWKPKDFWCSSLNYSYKADMLTTPEAIVWFENGEKPYITIVLKTKPGEVFNLVQSV